MVRRIDFASVSRPGVMDYISFSKLKTEKNGPVPTVGRQPLVVGSSDSVRFGGADSAQTTPPKNWLKTLLTLTLLGSSLPFAQAAKQQLIRPQGGKALDEPAQPKSAAHVVPASEVDAGKVAFNHAPITAYADWESVSTVNAYGFPQGAMLEVPREAIALATERNAPFHYVSGSEFVEMYVGAARVRNLFE